MTPAGRRSDPRPLNVLGVGLRRAAGRLLLACGLFAALPAAAAEMSTAPVLRIETGMHGAAINGLALDPVSQQLVTVSDDKTVRVWSAVDGQPVAAARAPIGPGPEGGLYAVTLSPSGKTVAVGGYTGIAWDGSAVIYLFNRQDGAWIGRVAMGDIKTDVITRLAFSPDGRYIAVAANDARGLRIVDTVGRSVKVADPDYKDAIQGLDFAADGRLVTTSLDGGVRLYDTAFVRKALYKAPAGLKPLGAAFSRDGSAVAVGMLNAATVVVLSGSDLKQRAEHKGGADRKGALGLVAWAADGSLLAAGTYGDAAGRKLIRKWTLGGDLEIPAGDDTVTGLLALPDGRLAFASAEPAWGLIGADGKTALRVDSRQADFRDGHDGGFRVSADGATVEFGFAQGGKQRARFDVSTGALERKPVERDDLKAAAVGAWTDWRNGDKPKLAGKAVALDANERARAAATQGTSALLGTDYALRAYRAGQPAWRTPVPAPAWTVNISGDGRLAVAGLGDGTIRWFRMADGVEVMSLFAEPEGERWVLWTPEGFFDHGAGGEALIGYHLNQIDQGRPKGSAFVKVEQLYALFFRRDMVVRKFRGDGETEVAAQLAKIGDIRTVLGRGLPPDIKLVEYCIRGSGPEQCQSVAQENQLRGTGGKIQPIPVTTPEVVLRFEVQDRGGGVGPIVVRRQGAPVPAEGSTRSATGGLRNEERVVPLTPGLNLVGLSVYNSAKEIETDPKSRPGLALRYQAPVVVTPVLRLLAIGVDKYSSTAIPALKNAAADAIGLAETMQKDNKREVFTEVDSIVLTNEQATLPNILKAFDDLTKRAKPDDLALVFLAGHGVDLDGKYYFLPTDLPDLGSDTIRGKALTHEELATRLGKFPMARTVVVLDTCYSGAFAIGDSILKDSRDQTVGKQISHASGRFILAGSANQEEALDGVDGHGVFTGVLLRGLAGEADSQSAGNKDGKISVFELGEFAKTQVPVVAAKVGAGHSQRPRWFFNGDDMFNVRNSN